MSQDHNQDQSNPRFGRDQADDAARDPHDPSQSRRADEQQRTQPAAVSTTLENDYWKTNSHPRPYVEPGASYDQYAPAYRYGWEMYSRHATRGRTFEEVEPELASRWENYRDESNLSWDKARNAARDAWGRLERSGGEADTEVLPVLTNLLHICMDGVKGFRTAAEKVDQPFAELFLRLADERDQCAAELQAEILRRGG